MQRCSWVPVGDELYENYHDHEWGRPLHDEHRLYEMFVLELFQAGLSWRIILGKRDAFRKAYDDFDINKVACFDEKKIDELMQNKDIIRSRNKIKASITNSQILLDIIKTYGSFNNYVWSFTNNQVIYEVGKTTNAISDAMSKDLKKRGVKYAGSVTIYSFLQAVGVINSHEEGCFLYHK
ncbi:DNA-3-methyladenine glycosylase I [Sharpea azabuensis]|uniref:DNA-3-methyladenine glycosylase I n=1 Tax=Sharpea porci TaxID=2652286 RepID=A0A844FW97_9FIRM|nr:DNA-3-methyladenine glycosylase I [Sharpea porci]MST89662.1 DNA-3-methyladenine glycosylase I [Sharpea porci]